MEIQKWNRNQTQDSRKQSQVIIQSRKQRNEKKPLAPKLISKPKFEIDIEIKNKSKLKSIFEIEIEIQN